MGLFDFLKKGLQKTKETFFGRVVKLLKGRKLDDETREELEELLIQADVGVETTEYILERLEEKNGDALESLKEIILEILNFDTKLNVPTKPPFVIMVVGVNGTGKTTSCGKLAKVFADEGKSVVLAAADTFRAAAIEQLKIWGERVGATVIAHSEGADPAAVAFDAVAHALARNKDVVIIDTAGRLHTKKNLMEELRKVHRVVKKKIPDAPHEILLVIDATTGQNGLVQAKIFKEAVDVTGIILTKLDGTAKGGITLAIARELGIPIKFIGVGEKAEDLRPFDPETFVEVLLSE
ncbi:signal recognition particle-docking protein FtsY [Thermotoga sp. 38H-to]|uniref:signal recognition particle-docking protein FtsY n=1 Tax=Thermotoga sp. 38H-to TaxID=1755812 RepID=UPI0013EA81B9|nr:signal recognition particle-docking protein FtsY [Thermotoga sp. 38H-to]KAF2959931.1 signal recognition particle-docking protein FtsY [Thermotoga sp. 38H-to]